MRLLETLKNAFYKLAYKDDSKYYTESLSKVKLNESTIIRNDLLSIPVNRSIYHGYFVGIFKTSNDLKICIRSKEADCNSRTKHYIISLSEIGPAEKICFSPWNLWTNILPVNTSV